MTATTFTFSWWPKWCYDINLQLLDETCFGRAWWYSCGIYGST